MKINLATMLNADVCTNIQQFTAHKDGSETISLANIDAIIDTVSNSISVNNSVNIVTLLLTLD